MCPDCTPPRAQPRSRSAARMARSPTGVVAPSIPPALQSPLKFHVDTMSDDVKESPLMAGLSDFCRGSLSIACAGDQRGNIDDRNLRIAVI